MSAAANISYYGPRQQRSAEIRKIAAELREKYSAEYQAAPWWKKILLVLRMQREGERIYRQRLRDKKPSHHI